MEGESLLCQDPFDGDKQRTLKQPITTSSPQKCSCSCCSLATGIEELRNSNLYHLVPVHKGPCASWSETRMNKDLGFVDASAFFAKVFLISLAVNLWRSSHSKKFGAWTRKVLQSVLNCHLKANEMPFYTQRCLVMKWLEKTVISLSLVTKQAVLWKWMFPKQWRWPIIHSE